MNNWKSHANSLLKQRGNCKYNAANIVSLSYSCISRKTAYSKCQTGMSLCSSCRLGLGSLSCSKCILSQLPGKRNCFDVPLAERDSKKVFCCMLILFNWLVSLFINTLLWQTILPELNKRLNFSVSSLPDQRHRGIWSVWDAPWILLECKPHLSKTKFSILGSAVRYWRCWALGGV